MLHDEDGERVCYMNEERGRDEDEKWKLARTEDSVGSGLLEGRNGLARRSCRR